VKIFLIIVLSPKIIEDSLSAGGIGPVATAKAEATLDNNKVTRGRSYTWSCKVNNTIPERGVVNTISN